MQNWFPISNVPEVPSPALLVYPDRVEENIRRMIALTGGPDRLRPHMKTNKLPEVVRMCLTRGITKFKVATIAEAEMVAGCGAADVLLAYQPVGPNVTRLVELVQRFPATKFSTVADDVDTIHALSAALQKGAGVSPAPVGVTATDDLAARRREEQAGGLRSPEIEVLLDIDCGMHRTGVEPGKKAVELCRLIASSPGLKPGGLHVYDGHIRDQDISARKKSVDAAFTPVSALISDLNKAGLSVPRVVAGGTPTFPIHAKNPEVECSPGTCVFSDASYGSKFPDLDFLPAALVLTRIVSNPGGNRLCLDLGHKAIASENPHPRVQFLGLADVQFLTHSEEHLVIETPRAGEFKVGDCLYGVPWHICPTVALHSEAVVVENGKATQRWKVTARDRRLTI
jgi:D-serine deaminase-like pyridoxal phosphate-dependent protein